MSSSASTIPFSKFLKHKSVHYFGSALYEGQSKPGTELAPNILRQGGLESIIHKLGWKSKDHNDISIHSPKVQSLNTTT